MEEEFESLKKLIDHEIQNKLEELILTRKDLRKVTATAEKIASNTENLLNELSKQKTQIGAIGKFLVETRNETVRLIAELRKLIENLENKEMSIEQSINKVYEGIGENKNLINNSLHILSKIGDSISMLDTIKNIVSENKSTINQLKGMLTQLEHITNLHTEHLNKIIDVVKESNKMIINELGDLKDSLSNLADSINKLSEALNKIFESQKENMSIIRVSINKQEALSKAIESIASLLKKFVDFQKKALSEQEKKLDKLYTVYRDLEQTVKSALEAINRQSMEVNSFDEKNNKEKKL